MSGLAKRTTTKSRFYSMNALANDFPAKKSTKGGQETIKLCIKAKSLKKCRKLGK